MIPRFPVCRSFLRRAFSSAATHHHLPFPRPAPASSASSPRPNSIGIHHLDIYFPKTFVTQQRLERHQNVSSGKFTVGLGQSSISFVNDREDIVSMCLTAVEAFMKKYHIATSAIGRLEVGTETIQDHAKSIKSSLMTLFTEGPSKRNCTDIEGVDSLNACYGGTHAVFNSVDWVESSQFDGRYAMFVCGDIAEYDIPAAIPTCGAGVVVGVVGPNAPLVVERGTRASYMEHAFDFYKPHLHSPFPVVEGKLSNQCYLRALDQCFSKYVEKYDYHFGAQRGQFKHKDIDYWLFHGPYNKLVQKAFARTFYSDWKLHRAQQTSTHYNALTEKFSTLSETQSYESVDLDKALWSMSKDEYQSKCQPATLLPRECGNMYTASLYASLCSLVHEEGERLAGKNIMMYSYGSGLAASMFKIHVPKENNVGKLREMQKKMNLKERLAERVEKEPTEFIESMGHRARLHHSDTFETKGSLDNVWKGAHYLVKKDEMGRRAYKVNQ